MRKIAIIMGSESDKPVVEEALPFLEYFGIQPEVLLLNIVISDYIVHIAPIDFPLRAVPGKAEKEHWYRTNWIAVEFALLYRWHSLIPKTVTFNGEEKPSSALRQNIAWLKEVGIDEVCRQASSQKAGHLGIGNTPDFLLETTKVSLKMARKCELRPYNAYRRHYGLKPKNSFLSITSDKTMADKLEAVYKTVDRLEWFVGIFAEDYGKAELMGELLVTMVANDAFTQALTNPLLSKNIFNSATFSELGMEIIKNTHGLADIIARNTGVKNKEEVGFKIRAYKGNKPITSPPKTEPAEA